MGEAEEDGGGSNFSHCGSPRRGTVREIGATGPADLFRNDEFGGGASFRFPAPHSDAVDDPCPAIPRQLIRTTDGPKVFCGNHPLESDDSSHPRTTTADSRSETDDAQCLLIIPSSSLVHTKSHKSPEDEDRDYTRLQQENMFLREENEKIKRDLGVKSKECNDARTSLRELQQELLRKSMHVGSLAFAVEGQVKEKTRWCSALREVNDKFKLLKMEHARLSSEASEYKLFLADMGALTGTIRAASKEFNELKEKFFKESRGRKALYDKILELKGNIRVFCRCRPLSEEEESKGASRVVDLEFAKDGELVVRAPGSQRKIFKFDCVFGPQADQETVFENTSPFATSVMDGYNVCVFAYGQTGTGKTFTMEGTREARGVNYRLLEELFRIAKERQGLFEYQVSVSVLEVYNEQIRDLLLCSSQPGVTPKRLEVKQMAGVHEVPGLMEARVSNMDEAWNVLQAGANARAVGPTNCNEHSSRSHCILCVMVKGREKMSGESTRSKLWLVDLAGSERVAKADVQGERLKEAQSINKSLSALGDVIAALAMKSPHVPFRNSKLTHLLQDSLGGASKTLMFVQISPKESDAAETLCSLNFASRVRGIELGAAKRQTDCGSEASKSNKHMLEKAKQEMKIKDDQMKKMEEAASFLEAKMKSKDAVVRNLQDRVKELESQLLVERKLARQHVDSRIAENRALSAASDFSSRSPLAALPLPLDDNVGDTRAAAKENNRRVSMVPAPRRESMIPAPAVRPMEAPLLTLLPCGGELSPPLPSTGGGGARRRISVSNILRRSLQKRVLIKPPLQQMARRGGAVNRKTREGAAPCLRAVRKPPELELRKERERQWGIATRWRLES